MRKYFCLLFLLGLSIVLTGCKETSEKIKKGPVDIEEEAIDIEEETTEEEVNSYLTALVAGNNQFAFKLYRQLSQTSGNIFFSPYSISSALALTYAGAKGQTRKQIQEVCGFLEEDALWHKAFKEIINQINQEKKDYALNTANALWLQEDYALLEDYLKTAETYYQAKVTKLNFKSNPEACRLTINKWVELKTKEKIKDLIPAGLLDNFTRLVLTNAIYFKGKWLKAFDEKDTQPMDFRLDKENTVSVPMMALQAEEAEFYYTEDKAAQVLELLYAGEDLSMLVILPKEDNLKGLEERLSAEKLQELRNALVKQRVDVYLPKFKFAQKFFLSQALKEMGMPDAFLPEKADFSGISGKKDLFISEVIHQAFVDVSEEGTEAAAATAVVMRTTAVRQPSPVKVFKADHPFIFIIQQRQTGNILFLGRVEDPRK